jgi:DNA-binding PadR family transcriptional regulator
LSEITDGGWKPSPGAIYPVLRRMENAGLLKAKLESEGGRRKILYSATKRGRAVLKDYRAHLVGKAETLFGAMMPLVFNVVHADVDGETRRKVRELSLLIAEHRCHMMRLPDRRIGPELDRMIGLFRNLGEERAAGRKRRTRGR